MSLWQAFRTQPLSKTVTPSAVEYRFAPQGCHLMRYCEFKQL